MKDDCIYPESVEDSGDDYPVKHSKGRDYHDGYPTSDHRDATKGYRNPNIDEGRDWSRADVSKTGLVDREPL